MKKHYEKPLVAIEYFELTQTIASCNIKIGFLDRLCVLQDPDTPGSMRDMAKNFYFTSGADGCMKSVVSGSTDDGICYHTSANSAFNS